MRRKKGSIMKGVRMVMLLLTTKLPGRCCVYGRNFKKKNELNVVANHRHSQFTILMTNQLKDIIFFFLFSSVLDVGGVCFQHGCILGIRS